MQIFKVSNSLKSIYLTLETTVIKFTLTITVRASQVVKFECISAAASLLQELRAQIFLDFTSFSYMQATAQKFFTPTNCGLTKLRARLLQHPQYSSPFNAHWFGCHTSAIDCLGKLSEMARCVE